jgi:hypothetical protein
MRSARSRKKRRNVRDVIPAREAPFQAGLDAHPAEDEKKAHEAV